MELSCAESHDLQEYVPTACAVRKRQWLRPAQTGLSTQPNHWQASANRSEPVRSDCFDEVALASNPMQHSSVCIWKTSRGGGRVRLRDRFENFGAPACARSDLNRCRFKVKAWAMPHGQASFATRAIESAPGARLCSSRGQKARLLQASHQQRNRSAACLIAHHLHFLLASTCKQCRFNICCQGAVSHCVGSPVDAAFVGVAATDRLLAAGVHHSA